jgi:hypothetical protein
LAKSKYQDHSELICSWGFKHTDLEMLSKADSENDIMLEMLIGHYEEFSFVNSSRHCCNENEDCEEAVV